MKNEQTLWGVPIEEARRIIEVYKYTHHIPSRDYQEGFEDGVKYMIKQQNSFIADAFTLWEKEWEEEHE